MPDKPAKRTRSDHALVSPTVPHGPRAYGYGPGYAVVKIEARRLRAAASRVVAGDSLRAIVTDFNRRGITNSRGRPWTIQTLRHILLNPHTAGLATTDARVQSWPGALDPTTHKRLVAILGDPTRQTHNGNAPVHLLTGIARCGLCDTPMTSKAHCNGPRYLCAPRSGYDACGRQSVKAARADTIITSLLLERLHIPNGPGAHWRTELPWLKATDPAAAFRRLTFNHRRRVIVMMFDRIEVNPAKPGSRAIEDRIICAWRT